MKANGSLSPEQFATLQSVYTFLKATTVHLDTRGADSDSEAIRAVRDLGLYCIDRMLEAFPELMKWKSLGDGGR